MRSKNERERGEERRGEERRGGERRGEDGVRKQGRLLFNSSLMIYPFGYMTWK